MNCTSKVCIVLVPLVLINEYIIFLADKKKKLGFKHSLKENEIYQQSVTQKSQYHKASKGEILDKSLFDS